MKYAVQFTRCFMQFVFMDELTLRAAALAYYATFSIFPLLLLLVSAAGFVLRDTSLLTGIADALTNLLPGSTDLVANIMTDMAHSAPAIGLLSVLGLLYAASRFFRVLETTISHVFGRTRTRPGWLSRLVGLLLALLVGPCLAVLAVLATVGSRLSSLTFLPDTLAGFLRAGSDEIVLFVAASVLFTLLYRFLPTVRPRLRFTIVGGGAAALVWTIVTYVFAWYVDSGLANYHLIYGPLATAIILLFWLYLTNLILLAGAELSAVLSQTKHCEPRPLPATLERWLQRANLI